MDGIDTPPKPKKTKAKDSEDAEPGGIVDIALKDGDLVLQIEHANASLEITLHSFRVSISALKAKSKYFERLLEAGRFGEGQQIATQHETLLKKFEKLALAPAEELPVIRIEDLGRISAVKSIRPLLTDFLLILHGQDTQATPPVSNLANLAIVADRFDALNAIRLHFQRKKERVRQRLLVGLMLDYAPWVDKYSVRLITKGWVGQECELEDPLWWDLPNRIEEELVLRRTSILQTIQSIQTHFLAQYASRTRQCRLGYDTSPECDSFQFGEMVRHFMRAGTLRLEHTIVPSLPSEEAAEYDGDIYLLLERLKQIPEYQVDRNHSHCGIRTRLIPHADLISAAILQAGICGECWSEDRHAHTWLGVKRPLKWQKQVHGLNLRTQEHGRKHASVRDFFLASEKDWA
ncbi:hypothetical protein E2P81_ATG10287 [Venturia nashicola]|nr:hypothetical protein E2P81_ATG10287 [Venturia nashicola]